MRDCDQRRMPLRHSAPRPARPVDAIVHIVAVTVLPSTFRWCPRKKGQVQEGGIAPHARRAAPGEMWGWGRRGLADGSSGLPAMEAVSARPRLVKRRLRLMGDGRRVPASARPKWRCHICLPLGKVFTRYGAYSITVPFGFPVAVCHSASNPSFTR